MSIFEELEESVLNTFNTSEKESLSDIGADEEERNKIENIVSSSISSELDVDYSDFANHVFFGSAYAAASFASKRIVPDYPLDGELQDIANWRRSNSPYENWFFDNYPKQQGYLNLVSGSGNPHVLFRDFEGALTTNSGSALGSYAVEVAIKPYVSMPTNSTYGIYSYLNSSNFGHFAYLESVAGVKSLVFKHIDQNGNSNTVSASYTSYMSDSHMISYVWNSITNSGSIFIDGQVVASSGTATNFVSASMSSSVLRVGSYNNLNFSGGIDDFRYWTNFSTPRSEELINKNWNRTIYANHSGGLQLYWKFNQPSEYGLKIVDQSGNGYHGTTTGSFTYAANFVSGTLGEWFKDPGDPILALNNSRVDAFITDQRTSGSAYDDENENLIFNLVPSFFTETEDDTELQQLFLLLTARHFDRLKIYIEHLSNVTKMQSQKYNGPPANLLDITAKHYGVDIGDIYAGSNALQYFFGENISSSGSIQDNLLTIKNNLKRNIVSNLIYLIKTKSTQEAIRAALHAVGLNDNIVSINEYTDLSGGISSIYSPTTIEQRVLNFQTSSFVTVDPAAINLSSGTIYQTRFLFDTASVSLTQSIFAHQASNTARFYGVVERQNLTSSYGRFVLTALSSNLAPIRISSSYLPMFDNEWVSLSAFKIGNGSPGAQHKQVSFHISSIDRSGFIFEEKKYLQLTGSPFDSTSGSNSLILGTSGTNQFKGFMQEFKAWTYPSDTTSGAVNFDSYVNVMSGGFAERYAKDWTLNDVPNFLDIPKLKVHLKMNDYTGSAAGTGELHDWIGNYTGSTYSGLSSSADFNFPGKYITKFNVSTTYDLNVDNDKIRIKNKSTFDKNDENRDIPFVSIDFSPVSSLNKEIMRWVGDISKFSNITGDPMNDFKDDNLNLSFMREHLFENRFTSKIDFTSFGELIKWFDNNFTYLVSQFIPLDQAYSLSNYVLEPHLLEFNKIRKIPALAGTGRPRTFDAVIERSRREIVGTLATPLTFADPGRFGSFVSSSANLSPQFSYKSSSNGLNHSTYYEVALIKDDLVRNLQNYSPRNYGNAYYTLVITGANYLKNTLNVVENFNITGIYYLNSGNRGTSYLSSSHGAPEYGSVTSSINGVQDTRWLWMQTRDSGSFTNVMFDTLFLPAPTTPLPTRNVRVMQHNHGIGYGGMWGQLQGINKRSTRGVPKFITSSYDPVVGINSSTGPGYWIGATGYLNVGPGILWKTGYWESVLNFSNYIEYFENEDSPVKILWPKRNAHNGVFCTVRAGVFRYPNGQTVEGIGETIPIENFNSLNLEILGRFKTYMTDGAKFTFNIKFQFFSRETPGEFSYEINTSSSISVATDTPYVVESKEVHYKLYTKTLTTPSEEIFALNLQRKLPKQKFMRVWIQPICENADIEGEMNFVVKGVLSKDKVDDEGVTK